MSRNKPRIRKNKPQSRAGAGKGRRRQPAARTDAASGENRKAVKLPLRRWPELAIRRWELVILILIATVLVYWGTGGLEGGWLLDDFGNIVNNNGLILHGNPFEVIWWRDLWAAMFSFQAGPLGRPLSLAFFALQRYWSGLDPTAFKAVNLVLHLIAVVLLYGFTRALLHAWRRRFAETLSAARIEWVALGIAAAWALHPMNLTPILYAVQRETIFAALFTLAGLWLYVVIRERFRTVTWPVLLLLAADVVVFTVIGAYAKETALLMPLFALVLELFVFRFRSAGEGVTRVSPWLYAVPFLFPLAKGLYGAWAGGFDDAVTLGFFLFTLAAAVFVFYSRETGRANTRHKLLLLYGILLFTPAVIGLYHVMPSVISGSGFVTREFSLSERVLTEGRIVLLYIFLTVIPWLPGMALHHDYFTLSTGIVSPPWTLGAFIILGALLLLMWLVRRKKPLIALGIGWFFASQVLESTIFPLELAYEHRIYLGDWGLILAVAALLLLVARPDRLVKPLAALRARIGRPLPLRPVMVGLSVAVIVLLGSLTAVRAWHWQDNLTLAKWEARHHPMSPRATYLVARIMTNRALTGELQYLRPAFEAAQRATRVPDAGLDPWVAMILLAAQTGRPVPDAWFDGMVRAVAERPFTVSDVNALQALIQCYDTYRHSGRRRAGCALERSQLERLFRAIHASPRFKRLGMNYANVLVTQANFIGYATAEQRARSRPLLVKAANAQRGVAQFQINVFNVALADGKFELATRMLARVEKLNMLGHLDMQIASMKQRLERARAALRAEAGGRAGKTGAPAPPPASAGKAVGRRR